MKKIILYYFTIPFWRAEVSRLSLFIGNIEFDDYRIQNNDYKKFKEDGTLPSGKIAPFRQLPVLEVDDKIVAQTGAIARYCGKLSGLYTLNDNFEAALIDQIIESAQDINYMVTLSNRDKDPEKKKIAREILSTKHLPKSFQFLENLIFEKNGECWFVGNQLSIADLAIWRLLGWLSSGLLDGVPTNILDPYKKLKKMCSQIDQHPRIREWMLIKYGKAI
ncbi:glutathione S-transferase family protein [Alphaproteobacteria bacterium]|nr:glutathione S-transferase family protein [Alphaproteobacteria bacterium]